MINTMITMPATPTASPYAVAVSPLAERQLAASGNAGSWRQSALDLRVAPSVGNESFGHESVQNESVLATAHRTADMSAVFGTRGRIGAVKSAAPPRGEPR